MCLKTFCENCRVKYFFFLIYVAQNTRVHVKSVKLLYSNACKIRTEFESQKCCKNFKPLRGIGALSFQPFPFPLSSFRLDFTVFGKFAAFNQ